MNTNFNTFKIQDALDALGVKDINLGTSTGANSFGNGPTLDSFSPVDGQKIGSVVCTSQADYEAVMMLQRRRSQSGEQCQHHNVAKLSVSLEIS